MTAHRRRRPVDQPALDINVDTTPPAHPDEQVARQEISRFYDNQVAEAHKTCDEAAAALAAAHRARDAAEQDRQAWREHGQITATGGHAAERRHPEQIAGTVLAIVGDAQGRYLAAARAVLAPALDAPTTTAAMAELAVLDRRPDTAARRAAADAAHERMEALCRWLTAHGPRPRRDGPARAATPGKAAAVSLTFTDIFCGAGGSSLGLAGAGLELKLAANHWEQTMQAGNAVSANVAQWLGHAITTALDNPQATG